MSTRSEPRRQQSVTSRFRAALADTPRYRVYAIQVLLTVVAILLPVLVSLQVSLPADPTSIRANAGVLLYTMDAISWVGLAPWSVGIVALICGIVGYWLGTKHMLYLAGLTIGQGLVSTAIKIIYPVPRPNEVDVNAYLGAINNAFPSGHVMLYVVFYGFLFYLAWTRLSPSLLRNVVLFVCAAIIVFGGISRLYLGTHWLADVVGAQVIGLVILIAGIELYERYVIADAAEPI